MTNLQLKKEIAKMVKYSDNYRIVIDIDDNWDYLEGEGTYYIQANIWYDGEFSDIFICETRFQEEAMDKVKKVTNYLKKHFNNVVGEI